MVLKCYYARYSVSQYMIMLLFDQTQVSDNAGYVAIDCNPGSFLNTNLVWELTIFCLPFSRLTASVEYKA